MSPEEGQEEYEETQAELKKYEDDVSMKYWFSLYLYLFCGNCLLLENNWIISF